MGGQDCMHTRTRSGDRSEKSFSLPLSCWDHLVPVGLLERVVRIDLLLYPGLPGDRSRTRVSGGRLLTWLGSRYTGRRLVVPVDGGIVDNQRMVRWRGKLAGRFSGKP